MNKDERYEELLLELRSLIGEEKEEVSVLSNVAAALHEKLGFFWTGIYRVTGGELLVGPFQGPVACFHIGYGKGVCGTSWKERRTIVVEDVEQFPGHIACSSLSRSEIVVPIFDSSSEVRAVLDIDSTELGCFDDTDKKYLEAIAEMVSKRVYD
jgi:GAF domain-containing protein